MKYDEKTVRHEIMTDPNLVNFREKVSAKSNGKSLLNMYVSAKTFLKNHEDELKKMDINDVHYEILRKKVDDTQRYVQEAEQMLERPQSALEKTINAAKMVTLDPLEKGIDVLRGF